MPYRNGGEVSDHEALWGSGPGVGEEEWLSDHMTL